MALNYYYNDVENALEVMFDDDDMMFGDTQGIIFGTMSIGINHITKDNYQEFYARLHIVARLHGWPPTPLPRIKQHIGLSTNATCEKTRAQWLKRFFTYEIQDTIYNALRECEARL